MWGFRLGFFLLLLTLSACGGAGSGSTTTQTNSTTVTLTETVSDTSITTSYNPVISDVTINVKINSATVNATLTSAYKGDITLATSSNESSAEVTYTYAKSLSQRTSFTGIDNRGNSAYSNSDMSLTTPVRYLSVEEIRIFGPVNGRGAASTANFTVLVPTQDFLVDYDANDTSAPGVDVSIRFQSTTDTANATLSAYPNAQNTLQVRYSYTPGTLSSNDTEYKRHSQAGTGGLSETYTISSQRIVRDSETISLIKPTQSFVLVKDVDYSINYGSGRIQLLRIVANTTDTLVADYKVEISL